MFPWLNSENDNYGQQQNQKKFRQNRDQDSFDKNFLKQNQSDQDLSKAQKLQYEQRYDRKQDENEPNTYNNENILNSDKYNPYYDNIFTHNLKQNRRSLKGGYDASNLQTPQNQRAGIDFQQDHKHQMLENNKQSYKDYYKNNVSEFQKQQKGNSKQTNEEKKAKLQNIDQPVQQGIFGNMAQNQNRNISPQQKHQEYANILKRQIEEKQELNRLKKQKDEENDFQNKRVRNRQEEDFGDRYSSIKQENRNQYNKKNDGFESYNNEDKFNLRKDFDFIDRENKEFSKQQKYDYEDQRNNNSNDYQYQDENDYLEKNRSKVHNIEPLSFTEVKKYDNRKNQYDEDEKMQRRKWNEEENLERNLMSKIYEGDEREKQIKKQKEMNYYKSLEQDIGNKNDKKENNFQDRNFNQNGKNEKSMLEQLGDNYQRQQNLHQQQKIDMAQDLQQQINEKKRQKQLEKEKQALLDKEYEDKIKVELEELKVKYQQEMQGKQLEISTLKKNVEKKKQEKIQKHGEQILSKASKQQPKDQGENSPKEYNNKRVSLDFHEQRNTDIEDIRKFNKRQSIEDNQDKDKMMIIPSQADIHLQARDMRLQKRHEDREKLRDSIYDQQYEYYASRGVNKEWNPPSYWQQKDDKNLQELSKLKDQLDLQTSLLQNEAHKIRQDAQSASEMKNQAFFDLENLKDQLKRQNMIENVRLTELKQSLGNYGYVQNDLLPQINMQSQGQFQRSVKHFNSNPNLLNQSRNSPNINYSQTGSGNTYNNYGSNKYGLSQPDILDRLVSSNSNAYRFDGNRNNNKTSLLDMKLEKRLNNVNLSKADSQLQDVDNLLNNLRSGL